MTELTNHNNLMHQCSAPSRRSPASVRKLLSALSHKWGTGTQFSSEITSKECWKVVCYICSLVTQLDWIVKNVSNFYWLRLLAIVLNAKSSGKLQVCCTGVTWQCINLGWAVLFKETLLGSAQVTGVKRTGFQSILFRFWTGLKRPTITSLSSIFIFTRRWSLTMIEL